MSRRNIALAPTIAATLLLALVALIPRGALGAEGELPAALRNNSCYLCHAELDDELLPPAQHIAQDIHVKNGLACHECHGGDPSQEDADLAMDSAKGFIGRPETAAIPEFCGRCHSDPQFMRRFNPSIPVDQTEKYWTSQHGQSLREGNARVATCVSCHDVHNIRPADDRRSSVHPINLPETCGVCHSSTEIMAGSGLPTDQLERYSESVHGRALLEKGEIGSPSCNDCHGNHGAAPPDVSSLSRVCGLCHVQNQELFQESPHAPAFADMDLPECEACHGNHYVVVPDDDMVGAHAGALCLDCHEEDDGTVAIETGAAMHAALKELDERWQLAQDEIHTVESKGVHATDAIFELGEARQHLIKARTQVHSFDATDVLAETEAGITIVSGVEKQVEEAFSQVRFRRQGLGISTLILTLVVVMLWLKIRQIEKAQ